MSAVLITVQNGTVDYVTDGETQVIVVDFDALDQDDTFPEDIAHIMQLLGKLPQTFPWRNGVIKRLNELQKKHTETLNAPD